MWYPDLTELSLTAMGEQMIDTAKDFRLGRIFLDRTPWAVYPAFSGFHGMEETIERIWRPRISARFPSPASFLPTVMNPSGKASRPTRSS
jgi:hypothetical protein